MAPSLVTSRAAAVAGSFYPADADILRDTVRRFIDAARPAGVDATPRALIGPHAGYRFSGPIAGSAYATLRSARGIVERIVLFGPAHRVAFEGFATSGADRFDTPMGTMRVDREAASELERLPDVRRNDRAHEPEHGLEVHLPFILETLGDVSIVPVLFGAASPRGAAALIEHLWTDDRTLVVVSSDLSHYLDYETARRTDRRTAEAIVSGDEASIDSASACGHTAIRGLMLAAADRRLTARCVDLSNSGDTSGVLDGVVGYGAFAFG